MEYILINYLYTNITIMKFIKFFSLSILSGLFFMQCSTAQKLEQNAAFKTDKAYYQKWVAGVKGGGSGINVFIPVNTQFKLDSLYFRGQKVALQTKPNSPNLYIGRILTEANQKETLEKNTNDSTFELKQNEAVVSYLDNGTIKYLKIDSVPEKKMEHYPSAPPKQGK